MLKIKTLLITIVLLFIFVLNIKAVNESKVKKMLELTSLTVKTLSCSVAHTSKIMGKNKTKKFILKLKQPDKIFIQYTYPKNYKGNTFIINGNTFIKYFPALKKIYKSKINKDKQQNILKSLGVDLGLISKIFTDKDTSYTLKVGKKVEKCGEENCYVVWIISKDKKSFFKQKFWLGQKSGLIKKLIINYEKQSETFTFSNYKTNINLSNEDFSETAIKK